MKEGRDDALLTQIAEYLNITHACQYLVYNLSEYAYDYGPFGNSVMEYTFPGLPCPPLDMLYMICTSMQSWLMIDPKNVVVLHCQGPRGRSSLVAACFLAFFYKSEFSGGARDALKVFS